MSALIRFGRYRRMYDRETEIKENFPSLSTDNAYIPIQALSTGRLLTSGEDKVLHYELRCAIPGRSAALHNKYSIFTENLNVSGDVYFTQLVHRGIERKYISSNGMIVYVDNDLNTIPLLVLCVRSEFMLKINRNNPDPKQFCLLINNDFINDEEHHKVYRNVKKAYIDEMGKSVDVLYSNDIYRLCYNNKSLSLPDFSTIHDMIEHYKSLNEVFPVVASELELI